MSDLTVEAVLEQAAQLAAQTGCTTETVPVEHGWDVIIRGNGGEVRSHYRADADPAQVARRLMQQRYAAVSAIAQP